MLVLNVVACTMLLKSSPDLPAARPAVPRPYWLIEVDVAKLSWCYRYKFDGGRSPPFFLRELKLAVGVVRV